MQRIDKHPVLESLSDREEVSFTFNGKPCKGYLNEMVSSALFAKKFLPFLKLAHVL